MIRAFFVLLLPQIVLSEGARYDNYRLYRLHPTKEKQLSAIERLARHDSSYDIWRMGRVNQATDVMVAPHQLGDFHEFLNQNKIKAHIAVKDIQSLVTAEKMRTSELPIEVRRDLGWQSYHNLTDFNTWLSILEETYPGIVEVIKFGETYEKRPLLGITIKFRSKAPGVFIESGIHAREWIAPASSSWIINEILKSPHGSLWRKFNYLYIPIFNPDGYEYTFKKKRTWRKSRMPHPGKRSADCVGTDLNRNWDIYFGVETSNKPCSEDYAGPSPFSDPETRSVSQYLLSHPKDYDIFFSFHSYGQCIMYPHGYTEEYAPLHELWQRVGESAANSIRKVHGLNFTVGSVSRLKYICGGISQDWTYARFNYTLTYTFELRDNGQGYVIDPIGIIPAGEEMQAGMETILKEYNVYKSKEKNTKKKVSKMIKKWIPDCSTPKHKA